MQRFLLTILTSMLGPAGAFAEPVETEIPGVTAELLELRTIDSVTRLAVRYTNGGGEEGESRFEAGVVTLVDAKSKQKHSPIRDANNRVIAGPISDEIGGGRVYVRLRPGQTGVVWVYFDALAAGTVVSVEMPQMFPFDDVTVTAEPSAVLSSTTASTSPEGATATLVSAKRADESLKARLKLLADPGTEVKLAGAYFEYAEVYLFDTVGKRRYPLLKDSDGGYQAQPQTANLGGLSFLPDWRAPILMSLTFQAPPDEVTHADLVLPHFVPFAGVAIEGLGGAGAGGVAATGRTLGLEGALKELNASVTPGEIAIDLSADVLFDFDKAELKPAAEQALNNLFTVVNSRPDSKIAIEGHTDVRGEAAYNQTLSEQRAESVQRWLVGKGVDASRIKAAGAGESRPSSHGTSETEHQKNRRVEIRIRG